MFGIVLTEPDSELWVGVRHMICGDMLVGLMWPTAGAGTWYVDETRMAADHHSKLRHTPPQMRAVTVTALRFITGKYHIRWIVMRCRIHLPMTYIEEAANPSPGWGTAGHATYEELMLKIITEGLESSPLGESVINPPTIIETPKRWENQMTNKRTHRRRRRKTIYIRLKWIEQRENKKKMPTTKPQSQSVACCFCRNTWLDGSRQAGSRHWQYRIIVIRSLPFFRGEVTVVDDIINIFIFILLVVCSVCTNTNTHTQSHNFHSLLGKENLPWQKAKHSFDWTCRSEEGILTR